MQLRFSGTPPFDIDAALAQRARAQWQLLEPAGAWTEWVGKAAPWVFAVAVAAVSGRLGVPLLWAFALFLVTLGVAKFITYVLSALAPMFQARRFLRSGFMDAKAPAPEELTLIVGDEFMSLRWEGGERKFAFSDVLQIINAEQAVMVALRTYMMTIPASAFADASERLAFVSLLKAKSNDPRAA